MENVESRTGTRAIIISFELSLIASFYVRSLLDLEANSHVLFAISEIVSRYKHYAWLLLRTL